MRGAAHPSARQLACCLHRVLLDLQSTVLLCHIVQSGGFAIIACLAFALSQWHPVAAMPLFAIGFIICECVPCMCRVCAVCVPCMCRVCAVYVQCVVIVAVWSVCVSAPHCFAAFCAEVLFRAFGRRQSRHVLGAI